MKNICNEYTEGNARNAGKPSKEKPMDNIEKIADYLEQYSKDVRELDRNPSRWECENAAAELKDNLLSDTNIVEIDPDAEFKYSRTTYRQIKETLDAYRVTRNRAWGDASDIDWEAEFAKKICNITGTEWIKAGWVLPKKEG